MQVFVYVGVQFVEVQVVFVQWVQQWQLVEQVVQVVGGEQEVLEVVVVVVYFQQLFEVVEQGVLQVLMVQWGVVVVGVVLQLGGVVVVQVGLKDGLGLVVVGGVVVGYVWWQLEQVVVVDLVFVLGFVFVYV